MRKFLKVCICAVAATAIITGCSSKAADTKNTATGSDATTLAVSEETKTELSVAGENVPAETMAMVDVEGMEFGTVTLGQYKGVEVAAVDTNVTDEEVETEITTLLTSNPSIEEVDRISQEGDTVNIDYTGYKDDVAFEGGADTNFDFVIGETSFIDGFKEGLMGVKKGEEKDLNLTFPADYANAPDLAGQAVVFKVKVNSVGVETPATVFDDAFAKRVSQFQTADEYRADIRKNLEETKTQNAQIEKENSLFESVLSQCQFEINQETLEAYYNNSIANAVNGAAMYSMDLATIAGMYSMTEDQYKEQLKKDTEEGMKGTLMLREIAKVEKLEITDADRESLAAENEFPDVQTMNDQVGAEYVDEYLANKKAMDFIVANAVVK